MGPMIFDEKALKALDEKLGNDLNQNLRASNRPRRSALEVMVEQHGRRMLDTCAAEGNVALTTVEGTAEQSDVTGESAVRAVGSSIFGPFEAGFGSQQDFLITAFGEWLHAAALSVGLSLCRPLSVVRVASCALWSSRALRCPVPAPAH